MKWVCTPLSPHGASIVAIKSAVVPFGGSIAGAGTPVHPGPRQLVAGDCFQFPGECPRQGGRDLYQEADQFRRKDVVARRSPEETNAASRPARHTIISEAAGASPRPAATRSVSHTVNAVRNAKAMEPRVARQHGSSRDPVTATREA